MGFADAVKAFFTNYTNFSGRSSRSEYWWPQLFIFVVGFLIGFVVGLVSESLAGIVALVFQLAILIPAIALSVRRLHDHDKSGWWLLIALIPILGGLYLLFLFVQRGTAGANQFGPDPLGEDTAVFN